MLELKTNKWEVGLVEILYPNGYKKRFQHNVIRLDSQEVIFPVKDYESMLDFSQIFLICRNRLKRKVLCVYLVNT